MFEGLCGGADVYYAGKAFLCTAVARWVEEEGLSLDVCTGGELAVAIQRVVPRRADRLPRQQQERRGDPRPLTYGVGRIVVDSFQEIERIAARSPPSSGCRPVMVRVTVGVEAHTHEFIATGHEDQKFGFSASGGQAFEAACAHPRPPRRLRPARPAQPHRQPDLRHRRLRDGRAPGRRAARPHRRASTVTTAPRSTSAAGTASPTPRSTPAAGEHAGRRDGRHPRTRVQGRR
jgi:hypothetical protein